MKKLMYIFAAFCACAVVSCNKDLKVEETPLNDTSTSTETTTTGRRIVTISAGVDLMSKTTYADGTTFSWEVGDKISVLTYNSTTDDYKYEDFVATTKAKSSDFTGGLDDGYELADYAVFPAGSHGFLIDSGYDWIQFNIPSYKDLSSPFSADLPMIAKKTAGVYTFTHCSGATKITIDNIPAKYTTVTVSFTTRSDGYGVKLSGTFNTRKRSSGFYAWDADYAATEAERTYSRKVPVTNNSAIVYIPFATSGTIYSNNTVTITGHYGSTNDVLYTNTAVKEIGPFNRAEVIPLKTLIMSQLGHISWGEISGFSGSGNYVELKSTYDDYYVYLYSKVKKAQVKWGTTEGSYENGTYIYYGFDTDKLSSTGTDYWGNAGKYDAIVLIYPYGLEESIRTNPYAKVNGTKKSISCNGTIGTGDDAMVETEIAVLRSDLNISKGTEVYLGSYASSNVGTSTSDITVTL